MHSAMDPAARSRTYGGFLHLEELLSLQESPSGHHDEMLFFTAHQIYELWFKILLHELERARDAMLADDVPWALYCLRRVRVIERVLCEQIDVLATISPGSFQQFRGGLYSSSGLQSAQFREIEFLSGLKDPAHLRRDDLTDAERERLTRRLAEPALTEAFDMLRVRRGSPDLAEILRSEVIDDDLGRLAEALIDHDEGFSQWRYRHVRMVERIIGGRDGTGGSSGVGYLRSTLAKRFFEELWSVRGRL
ncbi:tryptophan 2,3-dioxygenase family protein [Nonomuraea sp. NPDC050786]|uniref:tryptophan 2,3-dioxygenase n=1 Tax=Nonomuraea sp. NPDC050786 TaxID=3154840 RepID=UPI0033EF57E6